VTLPITRLSEWDRAFARFRNLGGANSYANAVNLHNAVVGNSLTASGDEHAFLWSRKYRMQDLGTLGGTSNAIGINCV